MVSIFPRNRVPINQHLHRGQPCGASASRCLPNVDRNMTNQLNYFGQYNHINLPSTSHSDLTGGIQASFSSSGHNTQQSTHRCLDSSTNKPAGLLLGSTRRSPSLSQLLLNKGHQTIIYSTWPHNPLFQSNHLYQLCVSL